MVRSRYKDCGKVRSNSDSAEYRDSNLVLDVDFDLGETRDLCVGFESGVIIRKAVEDFLLKH